MPDSKAKASEIANTNWNLRVVRRDDGSIHAVDAPMMSAASLLEINHRLQRIESILSRPNLAAGLKSMRALERLAREFWVKPTRRKKQTTKSVKR